MQLLCVQWGYLRTIKDKFAASFVMGRAGKLEDGQYRPRESGGGIVERGGNVWRLERKRRDYANHKRTEVGRFGRS